MNTTVNHELTEAELLAEHEADKARKEAIEAAEKEAKHEASRQRYLKAEAERREAWQKRTAFIINAVQVEAIKAGHVARLSDGKLLIDEVDVQYVLDITEERTHLSSWRSKPTGKLRVTVGDYGNRVSYPQRKDGSFNYEAIANALCHYANGQNHKTKLEAQQKENASAAAALTNEFFPKAQYGVDVISPSATPGKPVQLTVKFSGAYTAEQARDILLALRVHGIKLHYSE